VLLSVVAACGCSSKKTPTEPTGGSGSDVSSDTSGSGSASGSSVANAPAPGIGEKCGVDDACAAGLECVKYYGIAGASGPQFASCEKRCAADTDCSDGRKCATIADGPGRVCR